MIKAIVFDLDGTLVQSEVGGSAYVVKATSAAHRTPVPDAER